MTTKRRKILPRPRRPAWVERVLEERRPPWGGPDWEAYEAWRTGRRTVPGLPDAQSEEGQRLLATMRVSLR